MVISKFHGDWERGKCGPVHLFDLCTCCTSTWHLYHAVPCEGRGGGVHRHLYCTEYRVLSLPLGRSVTLPLDPHPARVVKAVVCVCVYGGLARMTARGWRSGGSARRLSTASSSSKQQTGRQNHYVAEWLGGENWRVLTYPAGREDRRTEQPQSSGARCV